jgi:hypothetical protein
MYQTHFARTFRGALQTVFAAAAVFIAGTGSAAAQVVWTDWTAGTTGTNGSAVGTLTIGSEVVGVTYTGEIAFIQTAGGTNYWNPSAPYVSATVPNAPPASDIIALSQATAKTITFSRPISGLLFALVSLNGNGYRFNQDFQVLSFGTGFYGSGTLTRTEVGGGVYQTSGTGEPHGVIEFTGTFSSLSWTSLTDEYWNGFTVGVRNLAPSADVPEPSSIAMLAAGAGAFGLLRARRRRA